MKKIFKNLSLPLCAVLFAAGCSCSNEPDDMIKAGISYGNESLVTGAKDTVKNYDLKELYDDLKSNSANDIAADKLIEIIADIVLFSDANDKTWENRYNDKIKEKLEVLVKDSKYQLNGEFSEELLKISLNSQIYTVTCPSSTDATPEIEELTCDYTTYIQKVLKPEAIQELLKEQYVYDEVLKEKTNLFTNKKMRLVEYISIDSTHEDALDFIHEKIGELAAENSTVNLEKIAQEWEAKLISDLQEKRDKIGTTLDANGSIMKDFTNGYTYSVEEGFQVKKSAIEDTDYFYSTIITSDSNDILNSSLVSRILSDNIIVENGSTNKSYSINGSHYVVNPLADANINERDIVIKDTTNNKYYLIKVEKVTENSTNAYDGVKVLAQNTTLVSNYLNYYLEQNKDSISVHDEEVYEYLKTLYPTIFTE